MEKYGFSLLFELTFSVLNYLDELRLQKINISDVVDTRL
jgi:hypothetical protein